MLDIHASLPVSVCGQVVETLPGQQTNWQQTNKLSNKLPPTTTGVVCVQHGTTII